MKLILFCASVLYASNSIAQVLGPPILDLKYHFTPGQTLHYVRHDETRNPAEAGGYGNGNYDINENIYLTVESVSAEGNTTLTVRNEESTNMMGGSNESQGSMTTGHLAKDIPLYRVTIDPFGRVLKGEVLKRTAEDSAMIEKLKNPNFNGWRRPDSSLIILELARILDIRPDKQKLSDGAAWHDSTFTQKQSQHYATTFSASGTTPPPSIPQAYDRIKRDWSIRQDAKDRELSQFSILMHQNLEQGMGGQKFFGIADEELDCCTKDGLPVKKTKKYYRIVNGERDPTTTKESITLVEH